MTALRIPLVCLAALAAGGCATSRPLTAFHGDVPTGQQAQIVAVAPAGLMAVDDLVLAPGAFDPGVSDRPVAVRAGAHRLRVRYYDPFADQATGQKELRLSDPEWLAADLRGGSRYRLTAKVEDVAAKQVSWALSETGPARRETPRPVAMVAAPPPPAPPTPAPGAEPAASRALDMLRYWWGQADEADRAAFRESIGARE